MRSTIADKTNSSMMMMIACQSGRVPKALRSSAVTGAEYGKNVKTCTMNASEHVTAILVPLSLAIATASRIDGPVTLTWAVNNCRVIGTGTFVVVSAGVVLSDHVVNRHEAADASPFETHERRDAEEDEHQDDD